MARDHIARVRKICLALPGVEEGTSYGTTAFRVRRKFLVRMKEDRETLVLKTGGLDEKELLMESDPDVFFETDHYKGWPGVLIRLPKIGDRELAAVIETAWRREAGKKLVAQFDAGV